MPLCEPARVSRVFSVVSRAFILPALLFSAMECLAGGKVSVAPEQTVIDEPLHVIVDGLNPRQKFVIRAFVRIDSEKGLMSDARFSADAEGNAEIEKLDPIGGSYEKGPMGLLWSMAEVPLPVRFKDDGALPFKPGAPFTVLFELEVDGQVVSEARAVRSFERSGVMTRQVRVPGVVATLFLPTGNRKSPGLIVVGGSEGGLETASVWGKLLASHGYASLALAYFKAEGLPHHLEAIPVETVKRALDYLATQREVDASRIGMVGTSRGSELTLLAASTYPQIKAVVVYSPSNTSWAALSRGPQTAAWTIGAKPVPFVPNPPRELISGVKQMSGGLPPALQGLFLSWGHAVQSAEIPVEKINSGVALISGKDDRVWPSSTMSDLIVARLNEHDFRHAVVNLSYESAGHLIDFPYFPTPSRVQLGGSAEGLARADFESWAEVLKFLANSLH